MISLHGWKFFLSFCSLFLVRGRAFRPKQYISSFCLQNGVAPEVQIHRRKSQSVGLHLHARYTGYPVIQRQTNSVSAALYALYTLYGSCTTNLPVKIHPRVAIRSVCLSFHALKSWAPFISLLISHIYHYRVICKCASTYLSWSISRRALAVRIYYIVR
jgi:hypothetical protein